MYETSLIHDTVRRHRTPPRPLPSGSAPMARAGRVHVKNALSGTPNFVIQRRPTALIDGFNFAGHQVEGGISPELRDRLQDVEADLRRQYNNQLQAMQIMTGVLGVIVPTFEQWAGVTSAR